MPALYFSFLVLLAWLPSFSFAFKLIHFSEIHQCGPFNVSFSMGKLPVALPLTLTILPFNSPPLSISIPDPSWNATTSTGAAITFLPYAAGTTFIASLDDANGNGVGFVSDIIKILSSGDDSCVSTLESTSIDRHYTLQSSLTQCQSFDISYNSSAHGSPSVRIFIPRGPSYSLNQTQTNSKTIMEFPYEMASYEMSAPRGSQLVMLFSDGSGYRESFNLTTVGGDATSKISCLSVFDAQEIADSESSVSEAGPPSNTIVGIIASIGSVVIAAAVLMGAYAYYRRLPHRRNRSGDTGSSVQYPKGRSPILPSAAVMTGEKSSRSPVVPPYLNNPPYPVEKHTASPQSPYFVQNPPPVGQNSQSESYESDYDLEKGGLGYLVTAGSSFVPTPLSQLRFSDPATRLVKDAGKRQSIASSVDIDQILDLATMYSSVYGSRESKLLTPESPHTPYSPSSYIVAAGNTPESMGQRERQRTALSVSPIPSASNFEKPTVVHGSHLWSQIIVTDETTVERTRDTRKSRGVYGDTTFQFLARPEPAVTRYETEQLDMEVERDVFVKEI